MENIIIGIIYVIWCFFVIKSFFGVIYLFVFLVHADYAWTDRNIRKMEDLKQFGKQRSNRTKGYFFEGLSYIENKDKSYFLFSIITIIIYLLLSIKYTPPQWILGVSVSAFVLNVIPYLWGRHDIKIFNQLK